MITLTEQAELKQRNELLGELAEHKAELTYLQRQLEALKRKLFGQSRGEQISDAQSQWPKLTAYVCHGQTRIDNNLTEQAIRPTKLRAKNWLFIDHPDAGHRAAIIYTILETCRRHQVEPLAYLDDVWRCLPSMTNHEVADAKMTPQDRAKALPVNTR